MRGTTDRVEPVRGPAAATVEIRPMEQLDLRATRRASVAAFRGEDEVGDEIAHDGELKLRAARWLDRMAYFLRVDPGGCWVATSDEGVVGFAISQNRGHLWYLATYGVVPAHRGTGIGRQLMDIALEHGSGRPGILSSTVHPAATRRYRIAGFSLHPQMRMIGPVDRSTIPAVKGLADGGVDDFEWMDRLDRQLRGAGHGPDHGYMLSTMRLIVSRPPRERGYAFVDDRGELQLLAAATRDVARKLLWAALAASEGDTLVNCITTSNQWAVDVGLTARLDIGQEGYLAVRGMEPPCPYLASGQFL